jgi:hypothetical protein
MPLTVYNRADGSVANLPPDQLQQGLVNGTLALDLNAGPVTLQGKDGSIFNTTPDKVQHALSTGAYSLLAPHQQVVHDVNKEEAAKGWEGSAVEGLKSAGNQFLFDLPRTYQEATDTPEEAEKRHAIEDYHQVARTIGGAAGAAGSLLAGGEIFRGLGVAGDVVAHGIVPAAAAADASLGTRLAGAAISQATQGAILSTPKALIEGTWGNDWNKAAETMAWGTGLGAVLGGGTELLKAGGQGVVDKVLNSELVKSRSGPTLPGYEQELMSPAGKLAQKTTLNLFGANEAEGEARSRLTDFAQSDVLKDVSSAKELATKLRDVSSTAKTKLNDVLQQLDDNAFVDTFTKGKVAIQPGDMADAIKQATDSPELIMPMNRDQKAARDMMVKSAHMIETSMVGGKEVVTLQNANKFVDAMREKWLEPISNGIPDPLDKMKSTIYQASKNFVLDSANKIATETNNPALLGALSKAKQEAQNASELEGYLLQKQQDEATSNASKVENMLKLGQSGSSIATKVGHGVGVALGVALGGTPGYFIGSKAGGAVLNAITKHWVQDKGLIAGSKLLYKAAQDGSGVWAPVMAADAKQRLDDTMSKVGNTIRAMESRSIPAAQPAYNYMSQLLGNSAKGSSEDEQHAKLANRLNQLVANPEAALQITSQLSSPFAEAGSPLLAQAYQEKILQAMGYLHKSLPQGSAHQQHQDEPFGPKYTDTVSNADRIAFKDKAEIVANPMAALNHMQAGTLSDDHLEALSTIYPALYNLQKQEILAVQAKHPDLQLPSAERKSIMKFLGYSNAGSNQETQILQSRFGSSPKPQPSHKAGEGKGKGSGGRGGKQTKLKSLSMNESIPFGPTGTNEPA